MQTIGPDTTGNVAVTVYASPGQGVIKVHPVESCVSNMLPGNPGAQPGFDFRNQVYQPVVPYVTRVR